jgi:LmbE family N-acetylglucosaminyl deacetylase
MGVMPVPAPHHGDVGTLLAAFAHPDDEAYLAGGLMAVASDADRRAVCVTATRGELGFPDDDPRSIDERVAVREAELAACLAVLGVDEHHWLDQPDGGCASVDEAAPVGRLCELLEEVQPDTVVTFDPHGQTYHPDHITISRWTTLAVRAARPQADLLYAVMTPQWVDEFSRHVDMSMIMMVEGAEPPTVPAHDLDLWFVCDDALTDRKLAALRSQSSQTTGLIELVGVDVYRALIRDEMYRRATPDDWPT